MARQFELRIRPSASGRSHGQVDGTVRINSDNFPLPANARVLDTPGVLLQFGLAEPVLNNSINLVELEIDDRAAARRVEVEAVFSLRVEPDV